MSLKRASCIFFVFFAIQTEAAFRFAVIGDYGSASAAEGDVALLVKSFAPEFILTTGDNNYATSPAEKTQAEYDSEIVKNIGPYYGNYIAANLFFPSLGNHDWTNSFSVNAYFKYFSLPGNERYYDFAWENVRFFAIDSDTREPDGVRYDSIQGKWLQEKLASASEPIKIVYFHHPPYSSGQNGSTKHMRWPFAEWKASAVLSGHDHTYERVEKEIPYFINGLGGRSLYSFRDEPVAGSVFRYNEDYGAMIVDVSASDINFQFYNRKNVLIDKYILPHMDDQSARSNPKNSDL